MAAAVDAVVWYCSEPSTAAKKNSKADTVHQERRMATVALWTMDKEQKQNNLSTSNRKDAAP